MKKARERKFRALVYALLISAALPLTQSIDSAAGAGETGAQSMNAVPFILAPALILMLAFYRSLVGRPGALAAGGTAVRSNGFLLLVAALLTSFVVAARPADSALNRPSPIPAPAWSQPAAELQEIPSPELVPDSPTVGEDELLFRNVIEVREV